MEGHGLDATRSNSQRTHPVRETHTKRNEWKDVRQHFGAIVYGCATDATKEGAADKRPGGALLGPASREMGKRFAKWTGKTRRPAPVRPNHFEHSHQMGHAGALQEGAPSTTKRPDRRRSQETRPADPFHSETPKRVKRGRKLEWVPRLREIRPRNQNTSGDIAGGLN